MQSKEQPWGSAAQQCLKGWNTKRHISPPLRLKVTASSHLFLHLAWVYLSFVGIRKENGSVTWNLWKSAGLKSLGEQPHQSTMCLYWHLQPSLRFQFVMRRLLSTMESQNKLFSRTVWKKDCKKDRTHEYVQLFGLPFSSSLQPGGLNLM